jgi:hypothetical protein
MKIVDQTTGQEIPREPGAQEEEFHARPPRRDRGDRGGGRERRRERDAG